MTGIIESYQQERALEQPVPEAAKLAEVLAVWSDGLEILMEGDSESDDKHYLCNDSIKYQPGDRVLVQKVGGSYIVVCRIGAPKSVIRADVADRADMADRAELALRTIRVDNMSGTYGDIEFAQDRLGYIWAHNVANNENQWVKLTGTEGKPTDINRPSWP